ncbi:TetR/AcrR family transcriptional regulator [Bifidobacterium pullorum]|uniref:TetR/AcrR family transcriptional regulator n=1 Tax=Bifidobacterium pullorum TaxID=78448 RepID=UPI0017D9D1B3|nr:TetR/AcrR family transcriptional regulator [Bifidobacterium sp.]
MARNAHPEVTRRRILDAAQKLFSEKGFEHTSMQDIVNELGNLSKGAIYHHFPGKEAILEELTHRDWEASHGLLDELHQRTDLTGLEKIREVVRRSVTNETHLNIQRDAAQFLEDPTTLAHNLQSWQTTVANGFHTLIMDGVEDGSITTEYPREAAILLSLLLNYWVACAPTAADTEPRTRCVATMLAAIGLPVFNEELIDLTVRGFQAINAPSFYPEPHDTADDRNR